MTTTTVSLGARLWAGAPEIAALAEALRSVKARMREGGAAEPEAPHLPRARMLNALVAGTPLPDDMGRQLYETNVAAQHFGVERNALVLMAEDIAARTASLRIAYADDAIAVLHAELGAIIAGVRECEAVLAGITTAEAVLKAGPDAAAAAWARLDALATRYRDVRVQQHHVTAEVLHDRHRAQVLINAAPYRDLAEHEPGHSKIATGQDVAPDCPPYADGRAHLRWLARSDVGAWVPTPAALEAAVDGITRAADDAAHDRAVAAGKRGPRVEARAQRARRDHAADVAGLNASREYR